MMTEIPIPSRELIEEKRISESKHYDFKREVNLDQKHSGGAKSAKERLIDDVVAFLNSGTGHIIVGVCEADGVWESYQPLSGDREKTCNRFIQVIQDNIRPVPGKINVVPIDVDGGFILDVQIPEHHRKPFQNNISGAFYTRSGSRNRVLTTEEIRELFADNEKMERDLEKLFSEFERSLIAEDSLGALQNSYAFRDDPISNDEDIASRNAVRLQIGILPRQYYDRSRNRFNVAKKKFASHRLISWRRFIAPQRR
jgi:predicted HTH transcriptional regulator